MLLLIIYNTGTQCSTHVRSGVFVVVVEVDAEQEVLQVRLISSVHQLGHH